MDPPQTSTTRETICKFIINEHLLMRNEGNLHKTKLKLWLSIYILVV